MAGIPTAKEFLTSNATVPQVWDMPEEGTSVDPDEEEDLQKGLVLSLLLTSNVTTSQSNCQNYILCSPVLAGSYKW